VINSNLYRISHCFQVIADVGQILLSTMVYTVIQGEPRKLRTTKFGLKKLET